MSSGLGLRALCILLGALSGCFCEHCREGAKYSGAIISPKLEVTKIMQVPHAVSMSHCSTACCDLSDCDLAWMFEHHCYLVSCQHKGNCEPKKMEKVRSYLTFVLRPQRLTALLGYRQVPPNMIHSMSLREDPSEEISSLKELAFLGKEHSLEEAEDYTEEYGQMEQNPFQLSIRHEGGNVDYADWGMIVTAENTLNASGLTHRDNHEELAGNEKQNVNLEKTTDINESKSEGNPVTKHPREHSEVTSGLMEKSASELGFQLPSEANSPLPGEVLIPSHTPPPPDILKLISTATVQASDLGGLKEDETMSLPSSGPVTQPSATVQVPLPTVATKTASRKNQPPVAVVSPKAQEISFPRTSTFIDGDQSTDDTKIVSYTWEEIEGPLREKTSADTPILHLSNLIPGNYTFRLTVIDADGAANSTLASLRVNKQVDFPPVANAGPNQEISLPQNTITLNGNQSKDDHEIVSYEWSLSPQSKDKMVVMEGIKSPYLQLSSLQEGNYTFQLTVSDSVKQQSTAEVKVTVQPKKNTPPTAVVGPYKELTFPVQSTILDGTMSTDDVGIVYYHWENISGPSSLQMENVDSAVATVSGLEVGTYYFRLTVKDDQGLSSSATLSVTVKEEKNHPPEAHAGGKHILVLPNNSIALDGSQSTDDQGIVSYLWIRDGQSPAAGDVIHGSDHDAVLQLTNLVEGSYIFHLKVMDAKGDSDIDKAIVEVQPDPKRNSLVELILQIRVGQLTEQQKDALVRQLAMVLNILDSEIKVQKIQPYSDASTAIVFYVQKGHSSRALEALDVAQMLRSQLLKEKITLPFKMLRIDTAACLLQCSGHGYCDPITKRCICHQLWMENLIEWYLGNGKSNCEWSILYVTTFAFVLIVLLANLTWFCLCYCKRKRTKIRKKTKYTILDNMDDQEGMELQPKYGIKHRSTEHNSSLMVSESEFDSDQDTIFSREKTEKEKPNNSANGSIKNGVSFSYSSKDR